jgi:flagellin
MAASRQLNITKQGLTQAIERLTTGKRINHASDDATGLATGTLADAAGRTAANQVKQQQTTYFGLQASDSALQEATNQATRMAELEGMTGGSTSAEYTAVKGLVSAAAAQGGMATVVTTSAAAALGAIATQRGTIAASMASAQSQANLYGINAESNYAQADNIMGADIGAETVNLTKYQIMMQAGTSALSQANQSSQSILGLFR